LNRFICDRMLKKLAIWLRIFGYDTLYVGDLDIKGDEDDFLVNNYRDRILLTRDKELYRRSLKSRPVILIKSDDVAEQIKELKKLGLRFEIRMERCSVCNTPLRKPSDEEAVEVMKREGIKEDLRKKYELWYCEKCKKLYWMGSHWRNMIRFLRRIEVDWNYMLRKMEEVARKRNAPVYSIRIRDRFKLLVSAILSTRTRDEQTIKAVKKLFSVVKKPDDLLKLSVEEIDELIRDVGFHRVKAKKIKELAEIIVNRYDSRIPDEFEELIKLPGVGRKVANLFLSRIGKHAIAIDTHVHRISNRMGIVRTKDVKETEKALREIVPKEFWNSLNKCFVGFGQTICKPRKPLCNECPFNDFCPKIGVRNSS